MSNIRERFLRDGYVVVQNAIDTTIIEDISSFLHNAVEHALQNLRETLCVSAPNDIVFRIDELHKLSELSDFDQETRNIMSGHFPLEVRLSELLLAVPKQKRLQAIIRDILGTRHLFMHMPPTARYVLPNNRHAGVPAHQDISYNTHMEHFLTAWVPLVDIDDACGGVGIYLDSGKSIHYTDIQKDDFWFKGVPTEPHKFIHIKIRPTDVLLLNEFIIHESMPNTSSRTRISIDYRFYGVERKSRKHYLNLQTWKVIEPHEE